MLRLSRRQALGSLLAGSLAGLLSACAQPTPTPTPKPTTAPTKAQAPATAVPTKVPPTVEPTKVPPTAVPLKANIVVTSWGTSADSFGKFMSGYVDRFKAQYPNVTIENQSVPWADYHTKLLTQIAGGTAPDAFAHSNVYYPKFISLGGALELQPLVDKTPSFDIKDFVPASLALSSYRGKLYGLPAICSAWSRIYNKKLFKELGLPDPNEQDQKGQWTWETFLNAAKAATKRDAAGKAEKLGCGDPGMDFRSTQQWIWQNGSEMLKQPNQEEFVANLAAAVEAVQFQADLINKHKVAPSAGDILVNATSDFNTGRIAMIDTWANLGSLGFDKFDHGDLVYPAKNKNRVTILHTNSMGVYAKTKYPEASWQFIATIAGAEGDLDQVNYGLGIAVRKSNLPKMTKINREKYHCDHPEVIEDIIATGRTFDITPMHAEIVALYGAAIDQVKSGKRTAKEVLDEVKPKIDAELAKVK